MQLAYIVQNRSRVQQVAVDRVMSRRPCADARAAASVDTAGLTVDHAAARLIDAVAPVLHRDAQAFGLRSAAT